MIAAMDQLWIPVANAARLLFEGPADAVGTLIALHGYAQRAEAMAEALGPSVTASGWALVSPEAPHRFYPKGGHGAVGASWMSSHGREHDIAANRRYLQAVLEQVTARWRDRPLALLGFSQGASLLWRLAHEHADFALLLAVGGDIPPELHAHRAPAMPPARLVRGVEDPIYTATRRDADAGVLAAQGWPHTTVDVPGGHGLGAELAQQVAAELVGIAR